MSDKKKEQTTPIKIENESKPICGIIMPISTSCDIYTESHWKSVKKIIKEACALAGYEAKLVSDEDEIGVIHNRIVQNIYNNEIVICDISARNANVMFELGLRLAFDKPTIIIKDDNTPYSFDTSIIQHLAYPITLKYDDIQAFILELSKRILYTLEASKKDDYTTFLKHFGDFKIKTLETKEISEMDYLHKQMNEIKEILLRNNIRREDANNQIGIPQSGGLKRMRFPNGFSTNTRLLGAGDILKIMDYIKEFDLAHGLIKRKSISDEDLETLINSLKIQDFYTSFFPTLKKKEAEKVAIEYFKHLSNIYSPNQDIIFKMTDNVEDE